jgi:putative ABC transport system substrate-binding protein
MRRRDFITLLGSAVAWPFAVPAQQMAVPVVAVVTGGAPARAAQTDSTAFQGGLEETGYIDGKNLTVEFHWLAGQYERLLMADLVRRGVAVIPTPGSTPAALAAKAATRTIPFGTYAIIRTPAASQPLPFLGPN